YRLLREDHFSLEYSFFIFAQSIVNALLPFQRDALYRLLRGRSSDQAERVWALASVPLFVLLLPLFVLWQPLASLLRRGCVVRQTFKKTDIAAARVPQDTTGPPHHDPDPSGAPCSSWKPNDARSEEHRAPHRGSGGC
ncbi:MAG: hypothetical protein U0610_33545, partial [bacterium]